MNLEPMNLDPTSGPTPSERSTPTILLDRLNNGEQEASEQLLPLVYAELRALAGSHFRGQPVNHTLQPTALVHEAYLRMIDSPSERWQSRDHFFAVAALAMRQILTDSARRRKALKRGGDVARIDVDPGDLGEPDAGGIDIVALAEAMQILEQNDPRRHRVVELRFFGGLEMASIARVLDVSLSTVEADWRAARAWLSVKLKQSQE